MRVTLEEDFSADLASLDLPTLVVAGARDELFTVDLLRATIAEPIKGARLAVVDCGHSRVRRLERRRQRSGSVRRSARRCASLRRYASNSWRGTRPGRIPQATVRSSPARISARTSSSEQRSSAASSWRLRGAGRSMTEVSRHRPSPPNAVETAVTETAPLP
jgi:hypothetical protein